MGRQLVIMAWISRTWINLAPLVEMDGTMARQELGWWSHLPSEVPGKLDELAKEEMPRYGGEQELPFEANLWRSNNEPDRLKLSKAVLKVVAECRSQGLLYLGLYGRKETIMNDCRLYWRSW